ncbi:MAG: hypothetical protein IJA32_00405 [Lachnospiraceae bacterium]|nr:hypothetical protein [Lachnospiraceae bacterium]
MLLSEQPLNQEFECYCTFLAGCAFVPILLRTILCESCGTQISSAQERCPSCGDVYGENKEYVKKKRAMNLKYLEHLKQQEEKIEEEKEYIRKTMAEIKRRKFYRHTLLNFGQSEPPVYRPAKHYLFPCEYCHTEIRGKSTDEYGCPSCGAPYKENLDLKVAEEEENLERMHYEEYMYLKDLEWEQNKRNEERDQKIDTKYAKQIAYMTKHGPGLALLTIGLIALVVVGINYLIMNHK